MEVTRLNFEDDLVSNFRPEFLNKSTYLMAKKEERAIFELQKVLFCDLNQCLIPVAADEFELT
jgi:hypothetical protein